MCVDGVVLCVGAVFVDGAMRALPRAAARAQSSAEAVVLAMVQGCSCACLSRLVCGFCVW